MLVVAISLTIMCIMGLVAAIYYARSETKEGPDFATMAAVKVALSVYALLITIMLLVPTVLSWLAVLHLI